MSLFHASQQWSTMSSKDLKIRFESKRCADRTFFGVGGGAIVGAVGGSDTCRFQSVMTCRRARRPAQRLEIFTGAGRRRAWTAEQKAAIVAESLEDGALVSHVARRHGLTPQQLFAWRRQARREADERTGAPAVCAGGRRAAERCVAAARRSSRTNRRMRVRPSSNWTSAGSSVWIWPGADTATVRAIIGALKAAK